MESRGPGHLGEAVKSFKSPWNPGMEGRKGKKISTRMDFVIQMRVRAEKNGELLIISDSNPREYNKVSNPLCHLSSRLWPLHKFLLFDSTKGGKGHFISKRTAEIVARCASRV